MANWSKIKLIVQRLPWATIAKKMTAPAIAGVTGYFVSIGGREKEPKEDTAAYIAQQVNALETPGELLGLLSTLAKTMPSAELADLRSAIASAPGASQEVMAAFDDIIAKGARYGATGDGKPSTINLEEVTRVRHATKELYAVARSMNISLETLVRLRAIMFMDEDLVDAVVQNEAAIAAERAAR